jgi:hypothetical protein
MRAFQTTSEAMKYTIHIDALPRIWMRSALSTSHDVVVMHWVDYTAS